VTGRKAPRPNGISRTRSGELKVRLSDKERQTAYDIAARKNRLFRRHKRQGLHFTDTVCALAFAKAQGEMFSYIARQLYEKRVWDMPDDPSPTHGWNARHSYQHDDGWSFDMGGTILSQEEPVVLGHIHKNVVVFRVYLPFGWNAEELFPHRHKLIVPLNKLKPIGELLDALQK
jgi:hypothetical protein